jgi:hypothetical protein
MRTPPFGQTLTASDACRRDGVAEPADGGEAELPDVVRDTLHGGVVGVECMIVERGHDELHDHPGISLRMPGRELATGLGCLELALDQDGRGVDRPRVEMVAGAAPARQQRSGRQVRSLSSGRARRRYVCVRTRHDRHHCRSRHVDGLDQARVGRVPMIRNA